MTPDYKHMDVVSRNQRLRDTLEGMGLFVIPVFCESDPCRIDYLQVAAELPLSIKQGPKKSASTCIPDVMTRPDVSRNVTSPEGRGRNVIDLPTKC